MTALLFLLPLGLIFDLFGYLPPAGRVALVYGLLALPLCLKPSRQAGWLAAGLALAALLRAWLALPPVADMAWLLLMHQAVWTVLGPVPRAVRTGTAAFALVWLALSVSPLGHPLLEALTRAGNGITCWLAMQDMGSFNFGATYQGLGSVLLFFTLVMFAWDGKSTGVVRAAAFLLLALLVNTMGAVILLERATLLGVDDLTSKFTWSLKFRDDFGFAVLWKHLREMMVIFYPRLLFLAHLVIYLTLCGWRWSKLPPALAAPAGLAAWRVEWRPEKRRWLLAALAAGVVLLVVPPTVWRGSVPRELVFVEKGVVSYTKPNYQQFGESAGGMFGMMPDYAALYGYKSTVVKEIPTDLHPNQALVLTSLDMDIGAETRQRIWDFVAKGGALWVLGDHTAEKKGRHHLNELLAPFHIRFVNDSAQFFPQGWFHSYKFFQGTPYARLRDDAENRPGILVGASLSVGVPAQPLVAGTYGYSDMAIQPPPDPPGKLDFVYQRTERLGDLVLVAGERHGLGRVLVFGDTSSFFNNNLARAHELLRANLAWLSETNSWLLPAAVGWRCAAAVLLAAWLALVFRWRGEAVAAAALAAVCAVSLASHSRVSLPVYDQSYARQHLALIDFSHEPNASKHTATDAGLHGISINLLRHGGLPVAMNSWDAGLLEQARYVVLNAPRRPITGGERADLMRFMERGGTVILGCGYLDAAGSRPLLEPLGCRIGDTPLGRFFDLQAFGQRVSFMSAWGLAEVPKNARVLCASADWPLIIAVPVGKGELVVIGDSEFLQNRNVEGHKNHDPQNTTFLKNLLDSVAR